MLTFKFASLSAVIIFNNWLWFTYAHTRSLSLSLPFTLATSSHHFFLAAHSLSHSQSTDRSLSVFLFFFGSKNSRTHFNYSRYTYFGDKWKRYCVDDVRFCLTTNDLSLTRNRGTSFNINISRASHVTSCLCVALWKDSLPIKTLSFALLKGSKRRDCRSKKKLAEKVKSVSSLFEESNWKFLRSHLPPLRVTSLYFLQSTAGASSRPNPSHLHLFLANMSLARSLSWPLPIAHSQ